MENQYLTVLKYLIQNKLVDNDVFLFAAKNKDFDIINILLENNMPINDYTIRNAVSFGKLELVEYLISIGAPVKNESVRYAAERGHLDIAKYLINILKMNNSDNILSCIRSCITAAACDGHLDIVKYLINIIDEDITLISTYAIIEAAANRHINVVKYLISVNAPIDSGALMYTSDDNIVKYLLVNGAPYEKKRDYIDEILKELKQEIKTNVSEYIGKDITSIILEFILI